MAWQNLLIAGYRSFPPCWAYVSTTRRTAASLLFVGPSRRQGRQSEARASNLFTIFLASTPDLERFFQVSKCLIPPFSAHSHPSVQNHSTFQLIYQKSRQTIFSYRKKERLPSIVVCQVVGRAPTSEIRAHSSWDGGNCLEERGEMSRCVCIRGQTMVEKLHAWPNYG